MEPKVERLRVVLVAATLLLVAVVLAALGYSRYRAASSWVAREKKRSGGSLVRETDGFTYSQSLQGRTVFTLHAAKAFQHGSGVWTLHNVVLTLYGLRDDRADRVYGNEFEWDETKGIARAAGEVQMDLQVPSGVAASERHGGPSAAGAQGGDAESIHVRTSGLVFLRKLGVAATEEQIEFRYRGLTCVAKGAEFDNSPSTLHLLANVQVNGSMRGKPVALSATKADFDRAGNVLSFAMPVLVSQHRRAHAALAILHLRRDGSVERAEATGGVGLDAGTRHVTSPRVDAVMDEKNQPQTARLSGGVRLVDESPDRPTHGDAGEVLLRFNGQGKPSQVTATNGAHLLTSRSGGKGVWLQREMRGDQIVAAFATAGKGQPMLQQVRAVGSASMRGESPAAAAKNGLPGSTAAGSSVAGIRSTSVSGDDLTVTFVAQGAKKVRPDRLHGTGHTVLRQAGPLGEERASSGDALDLVFAASAGLQTPAADAEQQVGVGSAVQEGHVAITSVSPAKLGAKPNTKPQPPVTGTADRASYDGASERLLLTGMAASGGVHIADGGTSLTASSVVLDQRSGDAEATGDIVATLSGNGAQATHVAAQHATLHHATQVAEFAGDEKNPARMWQEASQVEAATITVDRQKRTLVARPSTAGAGSATAGQTVHSVFAGSASSGTKALSQPGALSSRPNILRVVSREVEYNDALRKAVFAGPVHIEGTTGDVRAQRADVFFAPPAKAGKALMDPALPVGALDHVVVAGQVRMEQPGRQGTGEEMTYKASDGSFLLTGTPGAPPRVIDAQQGTVTGASLMFRAGDSTIVVTGAPAGTGQRQRARIDTHIKQ